MSLAPLLAAILPNLPALKQVFTKPKTLIKEASAVTIGTAAYLVYSDYVACGGLSCISSEHWGVLVASVVVLLTRLNAKRNEA